MGRTASPTATGDRVLFPALPSVWAVPLALLAGMGASALLPEAASALPGGDDPEPNAVQLALTAAGVLVAVALYLAGAAGGSGLDGRWLALTVGWAACLVTVKFVLSPAAFAPTGDTTLGEYVRVGLVVTVVYAAGLWALQALRSWPRPVLVLGVVVFAGVSRYLAALVLGSSGADYLDSVFSGTGWILYLVVGLAAALAASSFDRAGEADGPALMWGLGLIAALHGLWVVFMYRLFG